MTQQDVERLLTLLGVIAANSSAIGVLVAGLDNRLARIERAVCGKTAVPPNTKPVRLIPFGGKVS